MKYTSVYTQYTFELKYSLFVKCFYINITRYVNDTVSYSDNENVCQSQEYNLLSKLSSCHNCQTGTRKLFMKNSHTDRMFLTSDH